MKQAIAGVLACPALKCVWNRGAAWHARILFAALAAAACCQDSRANTFTFNTDPFAGTPVLSIPGRQLIGGEEFLSFSPATDVFSLDANVFGVGPTVNFFNGLASALPQTGPNVIVLENFDNDNNPGTPFGASNAADLIASRITASGPGFFVYFNQSLNLARLVYSTDLSSSDADLKVLARMLNLTGDEGRNALPTFTASNFEFTTATPEPSQIYPICAAMLLLAATELARRRRASRQAGPVL
jgi:hypothetical protein